MIKRISLIVLISILVVYTSSVFASKTDKSFEGEEQGEAQSRISISSTKDSLEIRMYKFADERVEEIKSQHPEPLKIYVRMSKSLRLMQEQILESLSSSKSIGGRPTTENLFKIINYQVLYFRVLIKDSKVDLVDEIIRGLKCTPRGLSPKASKGFYTALDDIKSERSFVVYSSNERYPLSAKA